MRPAVERNDARLVDHLVGDRDGVWSLDDRVRAAIDRRHHRPGQAARDAAIVEAAIFRTISRATAASLACFLSRGRTLLCVWRCRRNTAVRRIDDEPGAAAASVQVLPPQELWVAFRILDGAGGAIDHRVTPLLAQLVEFGGGDVLEATAVELRRPLERDVALVAVRVDA